MDLSFLLDLVPQQYVFIPLAVIGICSIIAKHTRPPKEGSAWAIPYKLLNVIAFNTKWAANRYGIGVNARDSPPR